MLSFVLWTIWAAYASAIIVIDHRFQVRRALASGEPDFSSGAPLRYLVLSLVAAFLVLPVYFYMTRRKWWAVLVGVAATLVSGLATSATVMLVGLIVYLSR